MFNNVVLAAGVNGANNNFGELAASSFAGYVYNDVNNDGVRGAGEAGIAGAKVTLTGTNDLGAGVSVTTTTAADGSYSFAGLRPGTYTITETSPAGYTDGKDTQGTPGTGTTGNDVFSSIALAGGVSGQNNDFGELLLKGSISIVTKTNGTDNDTGTGPERCGWFRLVTWTYIVTNTGNLALTAVVVSDDKAGAGAARRRHWQSARA